MNYEKIYNDIVTRAKNRKEISIGELHHIVPKSLGGNNTKSNLVKLTCREHYICHRLLTKMFTGEAKQKMTFAFYRLCNRHKLTTSRVYEQTKLEARQYLSEIHSGKTISEKHKQAIREKCRGMVGKKHSASAIKSMSEAKRGNQNAKVGIEVISDDAVIKTVASIKELCIEFNLTRGQAEHYIYNNRPYANLYFRRQKIIKRS